VIGFTSDFPPSHGSKELDERAEKEHEAYSLKPGTG
jgi:hypothetical protein